MLGVCEIPSLRLLPRMVYTVWSTHRADSILLYGPHRQRTVFCSMVHTESGQYFALWSTQRADSILLYGPHRKRTVFCSILLYGPHRERTVFCSMVHTESVQYFALWSTHRPDSILLYGPHSSGAVRELRWPSWAVRPNEPSGFRGRKAILNHASALVSACP